MNNKGNTALFKQYFKNGFDVVARNLHRLLCKINVVTFQLIIKTPNAPPTITAPNTFTLPKYSGAKNKASAPKVFKKPLLIVLTSKYQNTSNSWNFLKCKIKSCIGKE